MQVFTSHTVQDPIIHVPGYAAEELSTAIDTTRQALMPIFEILERIEDQSPNNSLIKDRAIAASNQLHICEERLQLHSAMAYAIQEKLSEKPAPAENAAQPITPITFREFVEKWIDPTAPASASTIKRHMDRQRWRDALEACQREIAAAVAMTRASADDEAVSLQADKTADAYHALLALRAPTPADAQIKLRIMREWECGSPSDLAWNSIMDDMEALTAAA